MSQPKLERREVLKVLCASTGALCMGACGAPNAGMAPPVPLVKLPAVNGGRLTLAVADFPQLKEIGGALVGEATGMTEPLAVSRPDERSFIAMPAICTHMTAGLRFNSLNATFDCLQHGSSFEIDGTVITGPATQPLRRFTTEFDGTELKIMLPTTR
jgi:Rieske Fe-S protein